MKLFVTGAGGMLGADLVRAARMAGHDVLGLGREQLDVTDGEALTRRLELERPDAVVNCAAYTDVDGAEGDEAAATALNAGGARATARGATLAGALVVYPSSDYVFDGRKGAPYVESDRPAPLSAYGRSKLAGERETAAATPGDGHLIVRSSWLFGRDGRNFVDTMLRLGAERDELAVVDDQVGSPTYTRHLAAAILELLEARSTGVHHAAARGACSWHDLARATFERSETECRVRPATTAELGRPAPRPAFSALVSERPDSPELPRWETGLDEYLAERMAAVTR